MYIIICILCKNCLRQVVKINKFYLNDSKYLSSFYFVCHTFIYLQISSVAGTNWKKISIAFLKGWCVVEMKL